jgi:putative PEP-CTERM system integral membrane protein
MVAQGDRLAESLELLDEFAASGSDIDVYLTSSPFRGEASTRVAFGDFQTSEVVYFGGQNAAELLAQFAELRGERAYDAILVFTDGNGYELGESLVNVPIPDAPVWLVHLGGDIPLGYDDQTLEAIQASGGGVVGELDQALARFAIHLASAQQGAYTDTTIRDVLDGYVWTVQPGEQVDAAQALVHQGNDGFIALAARQLILAEMQRQRGSISQLETLDELHALAKEYSIVTPYSSMIVLVTLQQEARLKRLEQDVERFEREFEPLGETAPESQAPLRGVPEPEEWLLIGMATGMLAWLVFKQRVARQVLS